jgi:hypothetical protein
MGEGLRLTRESKRVAHAVFPTRGVPYVTPKNPDCENPAGCKITGMDTPLIAMLEGRFKAINTQSISARAPPRECPTCPPKNQSYVRVVTKCSMLTSVTLLALC